MPESHVSVDWRRLVKAAADNHESDEPIRPGFDPPATEDGLLELEREIGIKLPAQLREFFLQCNGVTLEVDMGSGFEFRDWVVLPVQSVAEARISSRQQDDYEEIKDFLFFGGPGFDGLQYGFGDGKHFQQNEIVLYNPIVSEAVLLADSFEEFLNQACSGALETYGKPGAEPVELTEPVRLPRWLCRLLLWWIERRDGIKIER